jgi:hypothetical protein
MSNQATGGAGPAPNPGSKGGGITNGKQAPQQTNIGTQAADLWNNAYAGSNQLMDFLGGRMADNKTGYDPAMFGGSTPSYRAAQSGGYRPISDRMNSYMNPWTDDVVNATRKDYKRLTDMQLNDIGGEAAMSGAFGGSRHGLVEATAMSDQARNLANQTAQLRAQGFNTAADLAGRDVANRMGQSQFNTAATNAQRAALQQNRMTRSLANQAAQNTARQFGATQDYTAAGQFANAINQASGLSQQGLNTANNMFGQQAAMGAQVRDVNQQLINQSANMFDQYKNQPYQSVQAVLGALSGSPLQQAQTQTSSSNPGLKSSLGSALGLFGRLI